MAHFLERWGYLAIFLLTVAESAGLPAPSEVTLGLGGALAGGALVTGSAHHLNLALVIGAGVAGAVAGSLIAYTVGRTGGQALCRRFGRYVLLTPAHLDRAEAWFGRRGESIVLFGRVVPVVRTFISFPAGMAEMKVGRFTLYTAIGCSVWVSTLSAAGYALGDRWAALGAGVSWVGYGVAGLVVLGVAALLVVRRKAAGRAARATAGAGPGDADPAVDESLSC